MNIFNMNTYYVFTEVDTLTLWEIKNGEIKALKHDLVKVPDQVMNDEMHSWSGIGDKYFEGDYIDQDTGEVFSIDDIDLDTLTVIINGYHDIETVKAYLETEA